MIQSVTALAGFEGQWTTDGRYIRPHALTFRDKTPLMMPPAPGSEGHYGSRLVGRLMFPQRDENGRIWYEGMVDESWLGVDRRPYGCGFDLDQVVTTSPPHDPNRMIITSARVVGVTFGRDYVPAFPGAHVLVATTDEDPLDDWGQYERFGE